MPLWTIDVETVLVRFLVVVSAAKAIFFPIYEGYMKIKEVLFLGKCFLSSIVLSIGAATAAPVITVEGSSSVVAVGDTWIVSVKFDGLTSATLDSVSGYDFDFSYDPAVFLYAGANAIDPSSGVNQLEFLETGASPLLFGADPMAAGLIDVFAISGNSSVVLDAQQANRFTVFQLLFRALAPTTSSTVLLDTTDPFLLVVNSDSAAMNVTFNQSSASVQVTNGNNNPVPTPSVWLLGLIGFIAMGISSPAKSISNTHKNFRGVATLCTLCVSLVFGAFVSSKADAQGIVSQEAVSGTVVHVEGQRIKVLMLDNSVRWFTTKMQINQTLVGAKVIGQATPVGDTHRLVITKIN